MFIRSKSSDPQGGPPDSPILPALRYPDWDLIHADLSQSDGWRGFFVMLVVNLKGQTSGVLESVFFRGPIRPGQE